MRFLSKLFRGYCLLCGLLLTPAVAAVLLAHALGVLPESKVRAVFAAIREPGEAQRDATPSEAISAAEESSLADKVGWRLWERRLEQMGNRILTDVSDLSEERQQLLEREARLRDLSESMASLLTLLFEEDVKAEELWASTTPWIERVERKRSQQEKLPRLLETLGTVEPKTLAAILTGGEEGARGLEEERAVELLAGLKPRRAGEVLSEMGKVDPALAARLIVRLAGREQPGVGEN